MNRLFGTKNTAPKPTLTDAMGKVETRIEKLDVTISKLNGQLNSQMAEINRMPDGAAKRARKQRALKTLQQRKRYEAQRDQLEQQSFNMEQADMMTSNLQNVMTTVDALKQTNKTLKQQYGRIDVDKIEQLQDEMADLMEVGNEINESLGRSYDVPEDVDEAELDAELDALGQEVELEQAMGAGQEGELPSFMRDEVPAFIDEAPQPAAKEAAQ